MVRNTKRSSRNMATQRDHNMTLCPQEFLSAGIVSSEADVNPNLRNDWVAYSREKTDEFVNRHLSESEASENRLLIVGRGSCEIRRCHWKELPLDQVVP